MSSHQDYVISKRFLSHFVFFHAIAPRLLSGFLPLSFAFCYIGFFSLAPVSGQKAVSEKRDVLPQVRAAALLCRNTNPCKLHH